MMLIFFYFFEFLDFLKARTTDILGAITIECCTTTRNTAGKDARLEQHVPTIEYTIESKKKLLIAKF